MGCSSYTDDLSLFINGEISFEEIKDFFHGDTQTKEGIIFALKSEIFFHENENKLLVRLCYTHVLHSMEFYSHYNMKAVYLAIRDKCPSQTRLGQIVGEKEKRIQYEQSCYEFGRRYLSKLSKKVL